MSELILCIGCGASVPNTDDPRHKYIGSSPGCCAIYCEVLAKEYSDYRFGRVHRLTVDTYAVQHPGKPERRSIQSVAVHLIGLHFSLELEFDSEWARSTLATWVKHHPQIRKWTSELTSNL